MARNVLILDNEFGMGGVEKKLYDFIARVDRSRFRIVACALKDGGYFKDKLIAMGVPFYDGLLGHKFDVLAFPQLSRVLRKEKIDLIYTFGHPNTVLLSWLARSRGLVKSFVVSYHATGTRENRLVPAYLEPFVSRADALLALADSHVHALARVEGLPAAKFTVIPNGVDLERYRPGEDDGVRAGLGLGTGHVVFTTVASLKPVKGVDVLLAGIGPALGTNERLRILLVGDGPDRAALEAAARAFGERVVFAGLRDDVERIYRASDAVVLPSRSEAYPNVALEAMASGLPVITTDVGSVRDIVTDDTAVVVPPLDPAALADAITALAADSERRARMGRAGRERVEARHDIAEMCRAREDLFARLLGDERPTS
jgi:glycosyltransferase involved in cell wall biosynthesis